MDSVYHSTSQIVSAAASMVVMVLMSGIFVVVVASLLQEPRDVPKVSQL